MLYLARGRGKVAEMQTTENFSSLVVQTTEKLRSFGKLLKNSVV